MEKMAISYPTESQIKSLSHKFKKCMFYQPPSKNGWSNIKVIGYWYYFYILSSFHKYLISIKLFWKASPNKTMGTGDSLSFSPLMAEFLIFLIWSKKIFLINIIIKRLFAIIPTKTYLLGRLINVKTKTVQCVTIVSLIWKYNEFHCYKC